MEFLKKNFSNKYKISLIFDDPGSANLISHLVKIYKINIYKIYKNTEINFLTKSLEKKKNSSIKNLISSSDIIILGSSSKFELKCVNECIFKNKRVIVISDHWNKNWPIGYLENKSIIDKCLCVICISDFIKKRLSKIHKNIRIIKITNPFIKELKEKRKKYLSKKKNNIVYFSEPVSLQNGYNSHSCLKFFIKNIHKVLDLKGKKIIVRPHPKENIKSLRFVVSKYPEYNIYLRFKKNLNYEIINASLVAGCNTIPMYYSLHINKKVICVINKSNIYTGVQNIKNNKVLYLRKMIQ